MPPITIYAGQKRRSIQVGAFLATLYFALTSARAFTPPDTSAKSLHSGIVKDALAGTLNQANLELVIRSLDEQEKNSATENKKIYDSSAIGRTAALVDREQKKLLDYAADADSSVGSRYRCLKHLGILLSAVQDFYSRSNYLEIQSDKLASKVGPTNFDPYSIELVDWNKLNDARRTGQALIYGAASEAKENATEGNKALASTTYYKAARELAVRDTLRQWQLFETLVKRRYRDRANTILTALKEASCPAEEPDSELDGN